METVLESTERVPELELCLQIDAAGGLVLLRDGAPIPIRLRQCFPWSSPHQYLSLRDAKDHEVAFVDDPARLAPASRRALDQALAVAGFVLDVVRVLAIEEEVEIRQWSVETPSGRRSFQTHLDDWPRVLPNGALLIRDVSGDLYRLASPSTLDRQSRDLLWAFVDD